nr:hypothetical protein [Tanacetum cinerariifolium]
MILESVENGLLLWPTVEENGVTRPKKYFELSATEAIQADCDVKATKSFSKDCHQRRTNKNQGNFQLGLGGTVTWGVGDIIAVLGSKGDNISVLDGKGIMT